MCIIWLLKCKDTLVFKTWKQSQTKSNLMKNICIKLWWRSWWVHQVSPGAFMRYTGETRIVKFKERKKCAMCVKLNNFNSNIKINRLASNSKDEPNLVGTFTWDTISIKTSTWKDFKRQIKSCRSFYVRHRRRWRSKRSSCRWLWWWWWWWWWGGGGGAAAANDDDDQGDKGHHDQDGWSIWWWSIWWWSIRWCKWGWPW